MMVTDEDEAMWDRSAEARREGSSVGSSILMASASSHLRVSVKTGPASYRVRSRTRMPSSSLPFLRGVR